MSTRGPKMPDGVWKGVHPQIFGHSGQLLKNRFFDESIHSMRNIDIGEKKKRKDWLKQQFNHLYGNQLQRQPSCQFFRNHGLIPLQ